MLGHSACSFYFLHHKNAKKCFERFLTSFVDDDKTPKLSAADVALYGLHVIIPLMSSDVLMVSLCALQFSCFFCYILQGEI